MMCSACHNVRGSRDHQCEADSARAGAQDHQQEPPRGDVQVQRIAAQHRYHPSADEQHEGKLADSRHGRVEVTTDTNTDGVKSHVEADARHDAAGIRYLGPDHMKTIASFCP